MEKKLIILNTYLCGLAYVFLYVNSSISFLVSGLVLILSCIKVIFFNKYDLEMFLVVMIFNHLLIPAIGQYSNIIWNIAVVVLKYGLFAIIILKLMIRRKMIFHKDLKFTYISTILLIVCSLYNIEISFPIVMKRILPLIFFIIYITFIDYKNNNMIDIELVQKILGIALVISFLVYLLPNYTDKTKELMESGFIFKEPVYDIQYTLFGNLKRNSGVLFDARLLGIIAYLYLFILLKKEKKSVIRIIFSIIVSFSCFSRGATVVILIILAGYIYFYLSKRQKSIVVASTFLVFGIFLVFISSSKASIEINDSYLASFNIFGKQNVFDQRKVLRDMATEEFHKSPIFGNGVGWVTSKNTKVFVDEKFKKATDAYYNGLLAEIGIVGVAIFILSCIEIMNIKDKLNMFLLLGFLAHLAGTNIPDSGSDYIYIILIIFSITRVNIKKEELGIVA